MDNYCKKVVVEIKVLFALEETLYEAKVKDSSTGDVLIILRSLSIDEIFRAIKRLYFDF